MAKLRVLEAFDFEEEQSGNRVQLLPGEYEASPVSSSYAVPGHTTLPVAASVWLITDLRIIIAQDQIDENADNLTLIA